MIFEFVPKAGFDFLKSFSEKFKVPILHNRLTVPPSLGKGEIRRVDLPPDFKLIIHRYKLNRELVLKRVATTGPDDLVSIIFHSNETPASLSTKENQSQLSKNSEFAIQIASTDLDSTIRFTAQAEIYFIVVGIKRPALKDLLQVSSPNSVVQTILSGGPGFLFYESMDHDMQNILKQITGTSENDQLGALFYKIKVQELLYLLFEKLLKRETARHSPVHKADIEKLFLIRTTILSDLSQPPRLAELAKMAGLGETKMKDLFKQIFGDSIYNYYQKARMEEAALLLKNGSSSVSETGYQLGFTNLSHFSRQFEKHYGVKPKKYSSGG